MKETYKIHSTQRKSTCQAEVYKAISQVIIWEGKNVKCIIKNYIRQFCMA